MKKFIQIQWTSPSIEEARKICNGLVQEQIVACANIIPNVESIYLWKGEIETAVEVKVYLKTMDEKFSEVKSYILKNCSYEIPEIVKITLEDGAFEYLKWIEECVVS
jgi:periplasmic divalent cation tolerance protein